MALVLAADMAAKQDLAVAEQVTAAMAETRLQEPQTGMAREALHTIFHLIQFFQAAEEERQAQVLTAATAAERLYSALMQLESTELYALTD